MNLQLYRPTIYPNCLVEISNLLVRIELADAMIKCFFLLLDINILCGLTRTSQAFLSNLPG